MPADRRTDSVKTARRPIDGRGQPLHKTRPAPPERTYCLQYTQDTGSRINRTECRTKKDWERLGVDVDELIDK